MLIPIEIGGGMVAKKIMETINETIKELQERLKDFPADVNTYILLSTLREILEPAHNKLMMAEDENSKAVCREVKMISDISAAAIELLNLKKVEIKN